MGKRRRPHMHPREWAKDHRLTRSRRIRDLAEEMAEQPRCPGTGKVSYARPREAAAALTEWRKLNSQRHGDDAGSIYRCQDTRCEQWHLSSWAPGEYQKARNGQTGDP